MAHAQTIREKIFRLRKEGYSYTYISEQTRISKSTLSGWLSHIPYTPNQATIDRIGKARAASGYAKNRQKLNSIRKAESQAKNDVRTISKRDIFMLGIGIYIGEGSKTHGCVRVINADPKIIKFAIKWFKETCGLSIDNFRIRLFLYPDNDIKKCINFWSDFLGIPLSHFQKIHVDERKNKKMFKRGKLPYGTAHLSVRSNGKREFGAFLARRINGWIKEVLK